MKAIIVNNFGEADVLEFADIDKPEPHAGELLIKVAGAGVNPVDGKTRKGVGFVAEAVKDNLPWNPGFDVAGVVETIGEGVTQFQVGDRVYGRLDFLNRVGAYAEYTVADQSIMCKAPENIDLLYAAALPVAAQTAYQALFKVGDVKEGDRVLIHAGAGGVGHMAVQLAKMKGAQVTCTASGYNESFLKELGADEVIDYSESDFTLAEPFDFIMDNIGFEVGERSLNVLKADGLMVTVPTVTAERVIVAAKGRGLNVKRIKVAADKGELEEIAGLIDKGFIRVFVSQVFPLEQAPQAHKAIETGSTRGKIVLSNG